MSERTIFLSALEISDPGARAAYLDEQCRGNGELRSQIDALLAANARAGEFLERPAAHGPAFAQTVSLSDRHEDGPAAHQENGDATGIDSDELRHLGPSTRPDALGRLSHYDILTVLGRGAFGTVFKAFDTRLDRIVALKILSPELAASGPARRRFLREAKAAASVRHEHVVDIHAVDEAPTPHLVMECIIGQTLQQKLDKTGPLPVIEILRIGYQIASGLSAAHALGLIHRDIKPANILLENGVERVKITDFGLARAGDDASLTQSGIVCGTPMYMAPEQAQADQLDSRADLFSLGSTLYAMCTGHPPFRATTTMAVLKRVVEDVPRPIREVNAEIPDWLCAIVEKLLEKNPDDRFQTAGEVATLFSGHLAHLQHPATTSRPAAVWRKAPTAAENLRRSRGWNFGSYVVLGFVAYFLLLKIPSNILVHTVWQPAGTFRLPFGAIVLIVALVAGIGYVWKRRRPAGVSRKREASRIRRALDWNVDRIVLALAGLVLVIFGGVIYRQLEFPPMPTSGTMELPDGVAAGRDKVTGPEPTRPLPYPAVVSDAEGWTDLLTGSQISSLAIMPGVELTDGQVRLSPTGPGPAQLLLSDQLVPDGTFRLKARCLAVRDAFSLSLGLGRTSGTPRRTDAALHGPFATSPARLHLWQIEDNLQTTPLTDAEAFVVKEGTEIDLEFQRTGSQLRARLGTLEIATTAGLRDGWDAYPYLGATNSEWLITEWTFRPNGMTGNSTPLPQVDLKSWGRFVDPSGVGSLERDSNLVNVGVPGTQAMNLLPLPGYNVNAPRLVQHVTGDFEIAVAVPPYERPKPGTDLRPGGQISYRDAGLLVWQDDKTLFRFSRSGLGESYDGAPYLHAEWYGAGASLGDEREMLPQFPDNPTHLKIVRRGDRLILSHGVDGESWTVWRTVSNLKLAPAVQIGVMIQNSTRPGFKARFETLRVRATELPDPTLTRMPATVDLPPPLDFIGSLLDGGSGVFALKATDDGKRLVTGHSTGKLCVWDIETRRELRVIDAHESAVQGLVLLPDQKHAISSAEDGTIRMHDLDTGELVREFVGHTGRVDALCLADEGRNLVSATADFKRKKDFGLRSWRIESGEELKHVEGEVGFVGGMTSVQNGTRLVTADFMHQKLTLWDGATLEPLRFVPRGRVLSLAGNSDGSRFATGHAARTMENEAWDDPENCVIRLWDAETLGVERELRGHRGPIAGVAFSPDGQRLVSVSGGAHGPDGRFVASSDTTVRLWDVPSGRELARHESDDRLLRVAFLPDGQHFVTGGNRHLRLWTMPGEDVGLQ